MSRTNSKSSLQSGDPAVETGSSAGHRLRIVRWATLVGLLSVFAIAPKIWLDHDYFGPISIFGVDHRFSAHIDLIWFVVLIVLLIPAFRWKGAEWWIRLWCVVAVLRCFWDRITWQPFLLQYFCMLLVLGWYRFDGRPQERKKSKDSPPDIREGQLNALRIIIFSVYLWSGLAKFNFRFFQRAALTFFGPLLPADLVEVLDSIIWLIPVAELLLAVGLVTRRFHKVSVIGLLGMHLFILWMIGPLGADFNRVVWPWNLMMMVVLPTIFWNVPQCYPRGMIQWKSPAVHKLVFILCTILPALSYAGLWPVYLSFRMYSSREPRAEIQFSEEVAEKLPRHLRKWIVWHPEGKPVGRLSVLIWADQELGVFVPTEVVVYKHVAKRLWNMHASLGDMYLNIEHEPNFWTGEARVEQVHCKDL